MSASAGSIHRALLVFHRWLALMTAVVVIVVAATGAAISFETSIREAHAVRVVPGGATFSLDTLAARAIAATGGGRVAAISFGGMPDFAYIIDVKAGPAEHAIAMNPYTGTVIGTPPGPGRSDAVVRWMHQLHISLLAGRTGSMVVAFVALASLVLVLTGLVIWWRDKLWRINWSASWKRTVFDLHHALGLFSALVLLAICGTGVSMAYAGTIAPLVLKLNRTPTTTARPRQRPPDPGATPLSLDSLVQVARGVVPGAPLMLLQLPEDQPAFVALRYPEDHTPAGRSRVYIDRYHGTVLQATNTRTAETGTRLLNLQRPLHTGELFGATSQVIWLLASLVLATQAVTGTLMWWNGRAARQAAGRRP